MIAIRNSPSIEKHYGYLHFIPAIPIEFSFVLVTPSQMQVNIGLEFFLCLTQVLLMFFIVQGHYARLLVISLFVQPLQLRDDTDSFSIILRLELRLRKEFDGRKSFAPFSNPIPLSCKRVVKLDRL